jgi:hypothetical protein
LIPSVALLALLARALGCPLADLITKALPEFSVERGLAAQAVAFLQSLPAQWRTDLLPVLRALTEWRIKRKPSAMRATDGSVSAAPSRSAEQEPACPTQDRVNAFP